MHVAVDANVLRAPWGGIPKHVHRIATELVAGGDRVDLLVNRRQWSSPVPGARAVPIWIPRSDTPWREVVVPVWALCRRPDVLWGPDTLLPRAASVPTVVTVHDLAPLLFGGSKPPSVERAFRSVMPRSVRGATRVVCVSRATAQDAERVWGVDPARVRVVGNGVDARFTPGDRAAAAARVRELYGVEGPFVLHVGSLEPRKGLDVLIAAAAGADWRLVLAGTPAFEGERILAAAQAAGAAHLPGVGDDDLVSLYRAADVVAVPSLYEGFGMVGLEAMACGTPVVAAAPAGALEEVLGNAAMLVHERRAEPWAAAIASARERRAELAPRGLERAHAHRWPAVAAELRAVLMEAAGRGRDVGGGQ